jgi:hypothetical protein
MDMTVERTPATEYTREYATVTVVLTSGRTAHVAVYGPEVRFGTVWEPSVNWSAIGSVGIEDAVRYASAIAAAAGIAPTLSPATGEAAAFAALTPR